MKSFPPPGTRVALRALRLPPPSKTANAIEDQLACCRAYAERQGWVIAGAFTDAACSGATLVGRGRASSP